MSTDFEELVREFETVSGQIEVLSGNDRRRARTRQKQVEKMIASLAEDNLYDYDEEFAHCRDNGHVWEEKFSEWEVNELQRLSVCSICGAERYQSFSRTGAVKHVAYKYPEGYLVKDEELVQQGGRLKRYWRAVNIQRKIEGI